MDEAHFKTLKEISGRSDISQRELSGRIGISLGRVNFIVNSLIKQGLIKARRFKNSNRKMAYMYILTPTGIQEKVRVTRRFLALKMEEYENLHREIEELKKDVRTDQENRFEKARRG